MNQQRTTIAFINAAHAIDHMFMLILPTAVLGMGEFGRPYGEILALATGAFIAFGAGSLPAGWLGDLWSRRNMLGVFFIGIGAATVATGFATSLWTLAIGLTAIGLFGSIYHPVGSALLVENADKLGKRIGINGVWGNAGVAFAAVITGAITEWLGWRMAFILPGLVSIAIGIAFLALVPNRPPARSGTARRSVDAPRDVVVRALTVLAFVSIAGGIVFNATTVGLPKLFDERVSWLRDSPSRVGFLVAGVYMLGAMAQLLVGHLIDRRPLRSVFLPLSALQAPCLLLAAFAQDWAILVLSLAIMFAVFGQITVNEGMVARYTTDAWRSRVYAIRYFVSFGAAALAVPMIAVLHEKAGGFDETLLILAALGAVTFLGAIFFPHRPEEVAPPPTAIAARAAE